MRLRLAGYFAVSDRAAAVRRERGPPMGWKYLGPRRLDPRKLRFGQKGPKLGPPRFEVF